MVLVYSIKLALIGQVFYPYAKHCNGKQGQSNFHSALPVNSWKKRVIDL